jgi:hypothetical protein
VELYAGQHLTDVFSVAIFVFQLPALNSGETIGSATFQATETQGSGSPLPANIDLYGLPFRASSSVSTDDFFLGADDLTNATKLQDDFMTSGSTYGGGVRSTSVVTLTAYLNQQYANGATGENYILLRLNPDSQSPSGFTATPGFASADTSVAVNRPVLSFQVVPEPSAPALFLMCVLFVLFRRRCELVHRRFHASK